MGVEDVLVKANDMNIWRGYDRAGLDAQYNVRAAIPNHQEYFDRWKVEGEKARADHRPRLDVAYGDTALQTLNIFPSRFQAAPIVVHVHGGYWQSQDKADSDQLVSGFHDAGMAFVNINYTLAPDAGMDRIVAEVRQALAWVWRHADGIGGDPARVFVCGNSAGGHLAAMLAVTDWTRVASDLPADLVKGAGAVSGLYELEPIRLTYLNDKLGMDADVARRNSPLTMVLEGAPIAPLILASGGIEPPEFHAQQDVFAAALTARGRRPVTVPLPGLNHFDAIDAWGRPDHPLTRALHDLIATKP